VLRGQSGMHGWGRARSLAPADEHDHLNVPLNDVDVSLNVNCWRTGSRSCALVRR
jgi:hypothetical protein